MSSMRDRFKKRAKEGAQKGFSVQLPENVKRFSPKKGTYKLDVIPYTVSAKKHPDGVAAGELWCRRPFLIHYGIGVDNKPQVCPRTIGKPCPICEYYERERKRPGADEDALKEIRAKARELYNVIDLDNEDDGIQVLEMSYHLFGKLLENEINEADDDEVAGFAELKGGKTLKVRFSESSMGTNKFLEATRIDFLDRDDYKKSILDDVVDLDSVFNILPYEELEAVFLEDEGAGMASDEDEEPRRSSKKPSGGECPLSNGTFGKDFNKFDECDDCEVWSECGKAKKAK